MFNPDFTSKSWTLELLDDLVRESESAAKQFVDSRGHVYMKFTHQKKKWSWPIILQCLDFAEEERVCEFTRNAKDCLEEMDNKEYFTVLYFGESSSIFCNRMRKNDPIQYLSWFPCTHIIQVAHVVQFMEFMINGIG
jgi:hypothetical protein